MNNDTNLNLKRIDQIFTDQTPIDNPESKKETLRLCKSIYFEDVYIREKITDIEQLADIYFSSRKHQSFPGGIQALKSQVFRNISSIKTRIKVLQK